MGLQIEALQKAGCKETFDDNLSGTVGFEGLAEVTEKSSKSLHRMISTRGTPSMDNLAAIFGAARQWLDVAFEVHTIKVA